MFGEMLSRVSSTPAPRPGQRPWTYGAEAEALTIIPATMTPAAPMIDLRELFQQINELRAVCNQLFNEKRVMSEQLQIYKVLCQQLKCDRIRLTKQLSSLQRELHYIKRGREAMAMSMMATPPGDDHLYSSIKRRRHRPLVASQSAPMAKTLDPVGDQVNAEVVVVVAADQSHNVKQVEPELEDFERKRQEIGERKRRLTYTNSLRKSIEFSKSMLNLSAEEGSGRGEAVIVAADVRRNSNEAVAAATINTPAESSSDTNNVVPARTTLHHSHHQSEDDNKDHSQAYEVLLDNSQHDNGGLIFESAFASGVVLKAVREHSSAASAGLRPGDQVLEIGGINMRSATYQLANKIMADCKQPEVRIKLVNHRVDSLPHRLPQEMSQSAQVAQPENALVRRCTLTRSKAFMSKVRGAGRHVSNRQQSMLYNACHLAIKLPRRIHVHESLCAAVRLLGGNSRGIFVHSILDQLLGRQLQRGDRILEYNNINLRHATAEEAAMQLARPARDAVLLALFDIDTFQEVEENALGDSFYIRALFSADCLQAAPGKPGGTKTSGSAGGGLNFKTLEFQKGDILYVDSTMFEGRPGLWRAWKVDEFGRKTPTWGVIPSRYRAQCELSLRANRDDAGGIGQRSVGRRSFRRILGILRFSIFRRNRRPDGYEKLGFGCGGLDNLPTSARVNRKPEKKKSNVLAIFYNDSFEAKDSAQEAQQQQQQQSSKAQSIDTLNSHATGSSSSTSSSTAMNITCVQPMPYQMITLVQPAKPRPVILFGPYGDAIATQLEQQYPGHFRTCPTTTLEMTASIDGVGSSNAGSPCSDYYLQCKQSGGSLECISLNQLVGVVESGRHPVVYALGNTLDQFRCHQLCPIVCNIQFRSPHHLKSTVNQWWKSTSNKTFNHVSYNMAKTMYMHARQVEAEFKDEVDFVVQGNNLTFMAGLIMDKVNEAQVRITWSRLDEKNNTSFA